MLVEEKDIQRFLSKVEKTDTCWIWTGYKTKTGYGTFKFKYYPHPAHRFSYQIFKGEIPKGLHICHSCDNPSCVNPEHLWTGTAQQNMIDCVQKGRHKETRKTHCLRGHEYTPENTKTYKNQPWRYCRTCRNITARKLYWSKKERDLK